MPDLQEMQDTIAKLEVTLAQMKSSLASATPSSTPPEGSFEQLKELLMSDKWPVAANKNLICDPSNETDKIERGRGVVELMVEVDLANKKFLDYGCGEGHSAVYAATRNPTIAVGYDLKNQGWDAHKADKLLLTTNWDDVVANAPYDAILLFDVIDHLEGSDTPTTTLEKVRSILAHDGKIYLRVHPFMSRHALHNYHDLNKGFIQLVFTPDELKLLLPDAKFVEWNQGHVTTPLASYKKIFDDAALEIVNTRPVKDTVEPFFKAPSIAKRIMDTTNFQQLPEFQMGMQFIDYVLKKPSNPALAVQ